MKILFETNTSISLDAFTMFGINVKVTDNPLGRFGTGLKYAVAVILRLGGTIDLYIDGTRYEFYLKVAEFRGKEFQTIRMRKAVGLRWRSEKLPYTTELGKDWKLWQAYRELESNTRDENGSTYVFLPNSDENLEEEFVPNKKGTQILIQCEGLEDIFNGDEPAFMPHDLKEVYSDPFVTIYDQPSKHLFFRGIRVYDLQHPATLTYNFHTTVELTEDRTIKNIWWVQYCLERVLVTKIEDRDLLMRILKKSDDLSNGHSFENFSLNLSSQSPEEKDEPSVFQSVVVELNRTKTAGHTATAYHATHISPPSRPKSASIRFSEKEWLHMEKILREAGDGVSVALADRIKSEYEEQEVLF